MVRPPRKVNWIKGALKTFLKFPVEAQETAVAAITAIAEGHTPDIAKPMSGLGGSTWELAIRSRGEAYRVVYL